MIVHELSEAVVNTEASGLSTSSDTTLGDVLASATSLSVDILLTLHLLIGVLDPGHDLLVGAHVGSEAIDGGSNEAFLDKLHGVATSDAFKLSLAQCAGIDLDTSLGTAEGDISDGQLEGHKRCEGFSFL
jgi:hypothetical protein